jgi:integrase
MICPRRHHQSGMVKTAGRASSPTPSQRKSAGGITTRDAATETAGELQIAMLTISPQTDNSVSIAHLLQGVLDMDTLWGCVGQNKQRGWWYVKGKWRGRQIYFYKIPKDGGGFLQCTTRDMALILQIDISREMARGAFNPGRYRKSKPLHLPVYAKSWLSMKKDEVAFSTWKGYRTHVKHYISKLDKYLPEINKSDIRAWLAGIDKSPKYRKNIIKTLETIFNDALDDGHISQKPKFPIVKQIKRKPAWLTREQQEAVLAEIPARHRWIFRFMMATGVRPSEARALEKKYVYEDRITIARTFSPVKGGEILKIVKQSREEDIPIYNAVRELFDEMPGNLSNFVFLNPDTGKPYSKNINRDVWNPACRKALGRLVSLNNATRHSWVNQNLAAGMPIEVASKGVRHSGVGITKERYGDTPLSIIKDAVDG